MATQPAGLKKSISAIVQREAAVAVELADKIGAAAEPGFLETRSSRMLADYLEKNGFLVEWPWKHMPTAFRAVAGRGRPVIGVLAEYDALPDCGREPGTYGHGCGHNLIGVGAAVAAAAAANLLRRTKRRGQVVVWGCPAEELLAGKVYMARDGAFRGNDAILAWHPSSVNGVSGAGGSALDSIHVEYFGKTAHATGAEHGRSALDAVILLDVAVNYLREHMPEQVRIHMCIPRGGEFPNVVPAYAKSWYYIRGRDRAEVEAIGKRFRACARAAALATGTRAKITRLTGIYSRQPNDTLAGLLLRNLKLFGIPAPTAGDARTLKKMGVKTTYNQNIRDDFGVQGRASSDQDSVSRLVPFGGELTIACVPVKTPGHHRDYAARIALPFAKRAMLRAAEVLAASMVTLVTDGKLLAQARTEFKKRSKGFVYDPVIPKRQKPRPA
ncbi:MAG: amidohydrolase [Verrucomicrobia bacterium]|nr:amidohydrolase [Verrucomicrobiota bacterium]